MSCPACAGTIALIGRPSQGKRLAIVNASNHRTVQVGDGESGACLERIEAWGEVDAIAASSVTCPSGPPIVILDSRFSKRLIRIRESAPHMSHRTVVVSQPFFGVLEMAADDVDEWVH